MDMDDMRLFLAAARLGSISAAARQSALSQPAASRRIHRLERELGVELFDRSGSSVVPTRSGMEFLAFVERVLQQYEELRVSLAAPSPQHSRLHIAASTTPGEHWLPQVFSGFLRLRPDVKLTMDVMDSDAVEVCVAEKRCDLGFIGRPPRSGQLRSWLVAEDEIVLAVPATHPFAARGEVLVPELIGQAFVMRNSGSATRDTVDDRLAPLGFHLSQQRSVLEVTSVPAQLQAIAAGQGIGFISRLALGDYEQAKIATVVLTGVDMKRGLYMIQDPCVDNPLAEEFAGFARLYHRGQCRSTVRPAET